MKGNLQRFICPRCVDPYRTRLTDKPHAECEYCGEGMQPMLEWQRRRDRQKLKGPSAHKENEE